MPGVVNPPIKKPRHILRWLLLALALFLFPCGRIQYGDGKARLIQTEALLQGRLSISDALRNTPDGPEPNILQSPDGHWYSKYGLAISILWMLPVGLALLASKATGISYDLLAHFLTSYFNPLITLIIALVLWRLLVRTGIGRAGRWATLLVMLAGTMMLPMANTGFAEPLCALLLLWALTLPLMGGKHAILWGALCMGALATVKPELAIMPAFGVLMVFSRFGWRDALKYGIVAAWGIVWILATNWFFRGGPLQMSYGAEAARFQNPADGLQGYFLGLDRNIFVFNLGLIIALAAWIFLPAHSRWRPLRIPLLLMWIVLVLFYASWWEWPGGWCFGPRFFVPLLPLTLLPIGEFTERMMHTRLWELLDAGTCMLLLVGGIIAWSGVSVRNWQARKVIEVTHGWELTTQLHLLELKVVGGPRRPEQYTMHDFMPWITHETPADSELDFRDKPQALWLNHWWAIYLAAKLQHIPLSGGGG